jgi:peptidoglycan/LPS O-acetylase OafA/YrhL
MNKYIPAITGLRGISIIAVLAYHAKINYFAGGFFGVDVFFVISGFLIGKIIIKEISEDNFSLKLFYEKRIRRILPALLFCISLSYVIIFIFYLPNDIYEFQQSVPWVISFTSNLFFWKTTNYFSNEIVIKPLAHTWSLGIEEQFYFLLPLFFLIFKKNNKKKWLLLLVALLSFFYGFQSNFYNLPFECPNANCIATTNFYWLHTRVWELLIGVLINFIDEEKFKKINLTLIGLLMIIFSFIFFDGNNNHPGITTIVPVIGSSFLIIKSDEKNFINNILSKGFIYNLGKISYSLYLIHYPIFALISYFYLDYRFSIFGNISYYLATILSILVAKVSYSLIEQPFRKLSFLKFKNLILIILIISSVLIYFSRIPIYGLNSKDLPDNIVVQSTSDGRNHTKCMIETPDQNFDFEYCTEARNPNYFNILVVGDSTSQNTYYGVKQNIPINTSVSYLGVTSCLPFFTKYIYKQEKYGVEKCIKSYEEILFHIETNYYDQIILSFNFNNLDKLNSILKIEKPSEVLLFESLGKLNNFEILILGNPITWKGSLPRYISRINLLNYEIDEYNSSFLVNNMFKTEEKIKELSNKYGYDYLSVVEEFCYDEKCPIYFKDSKNLYLTTFDSLHFSRHAANEYGKYILNYIFNYR